MNDIINFVFLLLVNYIFPILQFTFPFAVGGAFGYYYRSFEVVAQEEDFVAMYPPLPPMVQQNLN